MLFRQSDSGCSRFLSGLLEKPSSQARRGAGRARLHCRATTRAAAPSSASPGEIGGDSPDDALAQAARPREKLMGASRARRRAAPRSSRASLLSGEAPPSSSTTSPAASSTSAVRLHRWTLRASVSSQVAKTRYVSPIWNGKPQVAAWARVVTMCCLCAGPLKVRALAKVAASRSLASKGSTDSTRPRKTTELFANASAKPEGWHLQASEGVGASATSANRVATNQARRA